MRSEHRKPYEFDRKTKLEALERSGNVCEGCGKPGSKTRLEADHLVPVYFAIKYPIFAIEVIRSLANLRILCPDCHKKRMHYEESEIMLLAWGVMQRYLEQIKTTKQQ